MMNNMTAPRAVEEPPPLPDPAPRYEYTLREASVLTLKFFGWCIVACIPLLVAVEVAKLVLHQSSLWSLNLTPIASGIGAAMGFYVTIRRELRARGGRWSDFGKWTSRLSWLLPLGLLSAADVILTSEMNNALCTLWAPPRGLTESTYYITHGSHLWAKALFVVIVAPVSEECVFRGLVLRGLLRRYSVWSAILISSALFGIAHLTPWAVVGAFSGGIILGWINYRTGSLLLCVLMHAAHNAMLFVVERLPFRIPGFTPPSALQFQPWWFDAAGFVALLLGAWLLTRATSAEKSSIYQEAH